MDPSLRTIVYQLTAEWRSVAPGVRRTSVALLAGILPWLLIKYGVAYTLDPSLLRAWYYLRGEISVPRTVSIVRLDKPAYTKIGLSPGEMFPRQYIAEGLRKITAAGAKVIVIDAVAQRPGDDPKADEAFAQALADTPTVIARSSEEVTDTDVDGVRRTRKVQNKTIDLFTKNAKAVMWTMLRLTGGVVEEICLANDRDAGFDQRVPLLEPLRRFVSPDIKEPGGFDFINFYGPPSTLTSLSIGELIGADSKVDPAYFKDRAVFIGLHSDSNVGVAAGKDKFITPVSSDSMFGVEIHATIAANLLDRSYIRRLAPGKEGTIVGIAALITTFVIFSVSTLAGFFVALAAMLGWLGFSYYSFVSLHNFIPSITFCSIIGSFVVLRWGVAAIFGGKGAK